VITDPGRASRDHRRLNAHDARAWLVYYVADCERDADHPDTADRAADPATLRQVVADLSAMLRRWDIANDGHTTPP
jgi:hypothetical protein